MEKKRKRTFSSEFKAKVVIEALKERSTLEELAVKYELHPNQIGNWKKEFLSRVSSIFSRDEDKLLDKRQQDALLEKLYSQIGQQKVEIDWLKKNL
jgi:transposase